MLKPLGLVWTGGRLTENQLIKIVIFQLIEISNNGILGFKKDLINCQNPSVLFSQLIKTFLMSF
jgi:hypothetical protein